MPELRRKATVMGRQIQIHSLFVVTRRIVEFDFLNPNWREAIILSS